MKLLSAEFVTSAAAGGQTTGIPRDRLSHVALAGRSNVGKSSVVNALCRRKIARTSAAPGKTRLANVYRATLEGGPGGPGRWGLYLVDLPGYGYARGGPDAAEELRATSEAYFRTLTETTTDVGRGSSPASRTPAQTADAGDSVASGPLKRRAPIVAGDVAALLLIDSRHPALESDIAAARWLKQLGISWHVVGTKVDKLSRGERARNLRELERTFGMAALPVSAESGEGLDELWQTIAKLARR